MPTRSVSWDSNPSPSDPSELNAKETAVHAVLQDWFDALEDGTAFRRLPRSDYQRPEGKEVWTEEQLDFLVFMIDDYVWKQHGWAENNHKVAFDDGPGYSRLGAPQRIALAQDLEEVILSHADDTL